MPISFIRKKCKTITPCTERISKSEVEEFRRSKKSTAVWIEPTCPNKNLIIHFFFEKGIPGGSLELPVFSSACMNKCSLLAMCLFGSHSVWHFIKRHWCQVEHGSWSGGENFSKIRIHSVVLKAWRSCSW